MLADNLAADLLGEISTIPIIDPHTHINPLRPAARSLDDILGYHYYTELAHSVGMAQDVLNPKVDPRERVRTILSYLVQLDNTAQYQWFLDICREFLDYHKDSLDVADSDRLWDMACERMAAPDWESTVLARSRLEKVFLTNDFDDPLEGFDTGKYVPCLRTDDLVFNLQKPEVVARLARCTGIEVGDSAGLARALDSLVDHFVRRGAKACAISLPPDFSPLPTEPASLDRALSDKTDAQAASCRSRSVFWMLAERCRTFGLPFDLMIGVNRRVYRQGVFQGQDLFDQRTSLIQFAELFNAFPTVPFCISVLSSGQNQELVSYSWIFPNVYTSGHWWYSNIPAYISTDLQARLEAVPKTKQIGYYSDMYKLEFGLPKYNMYRRILAHVLADRFVRPGVYTEQQAVALAQQILRDNVRRLFKV